MQDKTKVFRAGQEVWILFILKKCKPTFHFLMNRFCLFVCLFARKGQIMTYTHIQNANVSKILSKSLINEGTSAGEIKIKSPANLVNSVHKVEKNETVLLLNKH